MLRNYWLPTIAVGLAFGAMLAVGVVMILRDRPAIAAQDAAAKGAAEAAPRGAPPMYFSGPLEYYQHLLATEGVEKAEDYRLRLYDQANPNWREKVSKFIEELRHADAGQVVKWLARYGGDLGVAGEFDRGSGVNWAVGCLKDSRVSRLYQILQDMPDDQARRKCQQLFEQARGEIDAAWDDRRKATAAKTYPDLLPQHAAYAARCTVLLSALFCDADVVLGQLASWKTGNLKHKASALLEEDNGVDVVTWIADNVDPDDLFTIHILMLLLEREGKLTPEVLDRARRLGLPRERRIDMLSWATPADAGFLDPAEMQQYVVRPFSITYDWLGGAVNFPVEVEAVTNYLRSVLKPGEAPPADPEPIPAAP